MSGRAFVGTELNHDEEWIEATIQFTMEIFKGGWKLKQWNYFVRPLIARFFIPEIHNVWRYQAKARRILVPIMKKRLQEQKAMGSTKQKPNDMIQWLLDNAATDPSRPSLEKLAELQLVVSFAAIHTTTLTCTHVIFDLAARPEYIAPLRDELTTARNQYGDLSNKQALSQLSRLDSFMKESQRLNPPGLRKRHLLCFVLVGNPSPSSPSTNRSV
jgi:ent-kaurene oxidase